MEYVEGKSLQKLLEEGRTFTVREAAEAGLQLCSIMEQLHGQNPPMIFRDLKPANILVRPDGQYMLVDYGAVRKLRKSAGSDTLQLGTEGYAAPEQFGGWEQSNERTDIYGIGAVLHHMITGRPPLETGLRPLEEILGAEGETRPYAEMAKTLLRSCMTAPSMRYSSCKELEKALQGVIRLCGKSRLRNKIRLRGKGSNRESGWKRFVLLVNTAAVCLGLAIVFAMSAAGAETVEYLALIEKAQKETTLEGKREAYRRAAALRPEETEAYIFFLRDLAQDCEITEEEKRALDDVLFARVNSGRMWGKPADSSEGNLDRMRKKSPGNYAELEVELGKVYFACYEGGEEAARLCFRNALSAAGPWLGGRKLAEAMETVLGEDWFSERIDVWRELEAAAMREAQESGNGVFAAAVCKAASAEIALSADRYKEAGSDPEKVREVVEIAENCAEKAECGRIRVPERLREKLRTAVSAADRIVNSSAW